MNFREFFLGRGIDQIAALDYETYFDKDYTLKKLSTTAYIRDERFRAHGVGLKLINLKTGRAGKTRWIKNAKVAAALDGIQWDRTAILAHHTHFDGLITTHHYGHTPAFYLDTLSMARTFRDNNLGNNLSEACLAEGLMPKEGEEILDDTKGILVLDKEQDRLMGLYCINDVNIMWDLFCKYMDDGFPWPELALVHTTVSLYCEPLLEIDAPRAEAELERVRKNKAELASSVASLLGVNGYEEAKVILSSDMKLADRLQELDMDVPWKTTEKGNLKPAFAKTDREFLDWEMHPDERYRAIFKARMAIKSTLDESRIVRLLEHAEPAWPVYLNHGRGKTKRWSGGDKVNQQNFPRGGEIRQSILAPEGYHIVVPDSSQIEARMAAWLGGERDLMDAFADPKRDPYAERAAAVYECPIQQVRDEYKAGQIEKRLVGKCSELGLQYGMSWQRFQYELAIGRMGPPVFLDEDMVRKAVYGYRGDRTGIVNMWDVCTEMLYDMLDGRESVFMMNGRPLMRVRTDPYPGIDLPSGLTMWYPEIKILIEDGKSVIRYREGVNGWTKLYGAKLFENIVQALARQVVADAMMEVAKRYHIVMMSHDESPFLAKEKAVEKAIKYALRCYRARPSWCPDIPLDAECKSARNYSK